MVLPRNSGVFGWRKGAARRFSARRTVTGTRGKKIFKNLLERGGKPKNWGVRGAERWPEGTLYRVCGVIFRPGNSTSGSLARGVLRAGTATTGDRYEISEIRPSYIWRTNLQAPSLTLWGISACPTRNSSTFISSLRASACRILVTTISSQSRQETPC